MLQTTIKKLIDYDFRIIKQLNEDEILVIIVADIELNVQQKERVEYYCIMNQTVVRVVDVKSIQAPISSRYLEALMWINTNLVLQIM